MSGTSRLPSGPAPGSTFCQSGRPNSWEAPRPNPGSAGRRTGLLGHPFALGVGRQPGAADGRHLRQRRHRIQSDIVGAAGQTTTCRPLHSRPAMSPEASNARRPVAHRGRQRTAHRRQVGGGEEPVAAPADGETPDRPGYCRSTAPINSPIFSEAPSPSTVGRAIDETSFASEPRRGSPGGPWWTRRRDARACRRRLPA